MNFFCAEKAGRVVIIHLKKGDDLLEGIVKGIEKYGIKNGVLITAIGSLRKAHFHFISSFADVAEDVFSTIEEPIELSSVQGLIIEGVPHLHTIFSEIDKTYCGHLENGCEVQYLAEIAIMELIGPEITRMKDEFGVSYIADR